MLKHFTPNPYSAHNQIRVPSLWGLFREDQTHMDYDFSGNFDDWVDVRHCFGT